MNASDTLLMLAIRRLKVKLCNSCYLDALASTHRQQLPMSASGLLFARRSELSDDRHSCLCAVSILLLMTLFKPFVLILPSLTDIFFRNAHLLHNFAFQENIFLELEI